MPENVQGRSYLSLLQGRPYTPRTAVFAEKTYHELYDPLRCIRTARHKLIHHFEVASDGVAGRRGHAYQKKLFDNGLHLKSTGDSAIVAPPLIAEKRHIDEIHDKLKKTLAML